jgi:hypothetical protein
MQSWRRAVELLGIVVMSIASLQRRSKFAMLFVDEGKPRFQPTKPQAIAKLEGPEGKE